MKTRKNALYQKWIYGTALVSAISVLAVPAEFVPVVICIPGIILAPAVANFIALLCLIGLVLAPKYTRILYNTGEFLGQFAVTIDSFHNLIPANPYAFGYADHLFTLANLLTQHENFKDAEQLVDKLITLVESDEGVMAVSLVEPLSLMISVLRAQGKFDQSAKCGERLLILSEGVSGQEAITIASALGDLCASYAKQGRITEAETTGERALQLLADITPEQMPFGKEHLMAMAMSNLGCVYDINGKYDASLRMFQRALELKKKTMKEEDPSLAMGYINVSQGFLMQEKFDDALQAIQAGMKTLEITTEKDTLAWATALQNRGDAYRGLGNFEEAEKNLDEAFALKKKLVPKNDVDMADIYLDMAKLYRDKRDFDKSDQYFKDAISQIENFLRPDHPKMLRFLDEYSKLLKVTERNAEAEITADRINRIKAAQ